MTNVIGKNTYRSKIEKEHVIHVAIWVRMTLSAKIELNPSFVLSSDETNCKNDIQLFHQLFDELRVNRDCH